MIIETAIKTHLIVTDVHEEYSIKWCGKIKDTHPIFDDKGRPVFVVIGGNSRVEMHTTDMQRIENCAKKITRPHGRAAVTSDTARIYILEENDKQTLIGLVTHNHVKQYAPMFDKVYYR